MKSTPRLVTALLLSCLGATAWAAVPLLYHTPDVGFIGPGTSIKVTPDGRPSIAYSRGGAILYAVYDHPVWETEVVWQGSGSIWDVSLTLDSEGNPAVAAEYHWAFGVDIDVYVKNGSNWDSVYHTDYDLLGMPSLEYDSLDNLHLAYLHNVSLRYATDRTGSWVTESVPTADFRANHPGNVVRNVALAIKPTDLPAIAWAGHLVLDEYLIYTQKFASWTTEGVTQREVSDVDLDIGAASIPHISFREVDDQDLGYAIGPIWDVTIFDSPSNDGSDTAIALDSNDLPHISYHESSNAIRYLHQSGQQWLDQSIESGGTIGLGSSIALDAYDDVHFSYVHWDDRDLHYAASLDCNDNGLGDDIDIIVGNLTDCDENGHPDECEAEHGFLEDCNGNDIPDSCDPDCNSNGTPDDCESLPDCNSNGIPDECEALPDCNSNGIPDSCDIASGFSDDCNLNGVPDDCDIASGGQDCDSNGVLDSCDIESGAKQDCDLNGIPDECDLASGAEDCDGNGIRDLCEFGTHLVLEGNNSGDRFGDAVAVGDINGDGAEDIVVGAWRANGGQFQSGRIYLFYGGDLADAVADLVIDGPSVQSRLGTAVAVGDVNDDGFDDIIGGAPGANGGPTSEVRVYLGGSNPDPSHDFQISGGSLPGGPIGQSLAAADIDGDGRDDVIIGAPEDGGSFGKVFVFRGGNLNGGFFMSWEDEFTGDLFGASVTNAGDVDDNGIEDLLIGAPGYPSGSRHGRAYLYLGQSGTTMLDGPTLEDADGIPEGFGGAVGGAGDVNGDGTDDFVVGSDASFGNGPGNVSLFFGGPPIDTNPVLVIDGLRDGARMGAAVSCNGDFNGDGKSDLILASPGLDSETGVAQIFLGAESPSSNMERQFSGEALSAETGAVVSSLSDLDGDGFDEVVIAAPGHGAGRGRVYIVDIQPELCESSDIEEDVSSGSIPEAQKLTALPSPFRSRTRLAFELPVATELVLEVFDSSGRRVATPAQGIWSAGSHSVVWNSQGDGRVFTSGIYFARLSTARSVSTIRLELLK